MFVQLQHSSMSAKPRQVPPILRKLAITEAFKVTSFNGNTQIVTIRLETESRLTGESRVSMRGSASCYML